MKITKLGHACLIVEEGGAKFLIDPGSWNREPQDTGINAILITHEHADHMDTGQIQGVLARNPEAMVITHAEAGKKLEEAGIPFTAIMHNETLEVSGVSVRSCGLRHAIIYGDQPQCQNTGFVLADIFFVPGDALHDLPEARIKVLALPTGGPWMKLSEAVDYAKKIAPKIVVPIHDAMYTEEVQRGMIPRLIGGNLSPLGIEFRDMSVGSVEEF